ncbi:type VII secretion protein EccC, partial [Streptomyces sp. OF3]
RVRLLPRRVPSDEIPKGFEHPDQGIAIGLDEAALAPVYLNFETDPFLLVLGDTESGKTATIRLLVKQLTEYYQPDEAKFAVCDFRRTLLETVPDDYLVEYAPLAAALEAQADGIRQLMEKRAPQADITPQQLRDRSWWSGPRLFVVVDDFDLVATSAGNPLDQLVEHLPYARDIGIRFIIARNTAGASRAMYEPFLTRMKELGAQGIVLSGDPSESDLIGNVTP